MVRFSTDSASFARSKELASLHFVTGARPFFWQFPSIYL